MKAGEVVEAAFVTQLLDAEAVLDQQLTGLPHADLDQEL